MKKILLLLLLFFSCPFYAQEDTLSIVRHTENDIVTPKELKVVYRGSSNKLFIDVTHSQSLKLSGNGTSKLSKTTYILYPGAASEQLITITHALKNNKKVTEKHVFKIKNMATVAPTFNKIIGTSVIILPKSAFKNGVVSAIIPDKNIEEIFEVTGFSIKIPGMGAIVIKGNKIDADTYEKVVKNTSRGDQITVAEIKTRTVKSDYNIMCIMTAPMIIQIL